MAYFGYGSLNKPGGLRHSTGLGFVTWLKHVHPVLFYDQFIQGSQVCVQNVTSFWYDALLYHFEERGRLQLIRESWLQIWYKYRGQETVVTVFWSSASNAIAKDCFASAFGVLITLILLCED